MCSELGKVAARMREHVVLDKPSPVCLQSSRCPTWAAVVVVDAGIDAAQRSAAASPWLAAWGRELGRAVDEESGSASSRLRPRRAGVAPEADQPPYPTYTGRGAPGGKQG